MSVYFILSMESLSPQQPVGVQNDSNHMKSFPLIYIISMCINTPQREGEEEGAGRRMLGQQHNNGDLAC